VLDRREDLPRGLASGLFVEARARAQGLDVGSRPRRRSSAQQSGEALFANLFRERGEEAGEEAEAGARRVVRVPNRHAHPQGQTIILILP
jgi:hypothetical protein